MHLHALGLLIGSLDDRLAGFLLVDWFQLVALGSGLVGWLACAAFALAIRKACVERC